MLKTMFNFSIISGKKKISRGIFFLIIGISLIAWLPKTAMAQDNYEIAWAYTIDNGDSDYACGVATDGLGNIIVTGCSNIAGNDVYFTVKYDPDGNILWTDTLTEGNRANGVATDGSDNIIVTGFVGFLPWLYDYYTVKYDSDGNVLWADALAEGNNANGVATDGAGNIIVTGASIVAGNNYYLTVKYDPDGNILWTDTFAGPGGEYANAVATDVSDNIIVTGVGSNYNYLTVKYDSDGNVLWADTLDNGPDDRAFGVATDISGNIIVTGYSNIAGNDDCLTVKYDPDGNILWTDAIDNGPDDRASAVATDGSGNIIVTGYSQIAGNADYFTVKYDPDGNILWADTIDNGGNDYANGVATDVSDNFIVTGSSNAAGDYDYFTVKYVPAGITGDFNSDGYVDAADLQLLGDHWHFVSTDPGWDPLYDLVPDNIIDAADLQVFGDHWHEGTPPRSGQGGRGPNEFAGIVFDLDATTYGNQNLTGIPSQPPGTHIPVDVYCTDVVNLDTYEFEVIYNPSELEYVSSGATNPITYEGNILESNGGTALGWMVDTSTPGVLSIAYTLAGNDPLEAPEGEGLIADIVFLSLVDTYGTLSFGDVYYYDSYGVVDLITDKGTASIGGGEVVTLPIPTGDPVYFDFDGGGGSGGSTVTIDPPAGGGSITITQYDTPPESLPFPGNALNLWFDIDATSYSGGFPVDVTFTWDTPVPVGSSAPILAVSTDGGTSWQEAIATGWNLTTLSYWVTFTASSFSYYAMGNGDDNPLPVTLTSFFAEFVADNLTIMWTTQSENNNLGWNIYRGESDTALEEDNTTQINVGLIVGAGTTSEPTNYEFIDEYPVETNNTYWYWLESVSNSNDTEIYGPTSLTIPEEEITPPLPTITLLRGNYPNPFNPTTFIQFDIKESETAELTIFNIRGQIVESKTFEAGAYNYEWNSKDNASGVYFYKLKSESYSEFKKMMLLK